MAGPFLYEKIRFKLKITRFAQVLIIYQGNVLK